MSALTGRNLRAFPALVPRVPAQSILESKMTRLTLTAIILGASLLAGCSVSKDGMSLSEYKFVDNNCSGNGFLVNESWCRDTLHASMGPYSN